jgi:outer membrane protein assembly factor BamA
MEFLEVYGRVENEFWEGHAQRAQTRPGVERYDDLAAVGIRYFRNYLTPYWDPEAGYRLDLFYENGSTFLGGDESYNAAQGELSFIKGLPPGLAYLSETRLAARLYGGVCLPDNGEFFQLGGPRYLRGLERADRQGNTVWLASLEWRFPLWRDIDYDACDHTARLKHLYGAAFYDVGAIYVNSAIVENVAHSVGLGLRFDVAVFSFIERATLRLDVAKVVNDDTPFQVWFAFQHAF